MYAIETSLSLHERGPSREDLDRIADWIVLFPFPPDASRLRKIPYGELLLRRRVGKSPDGPDSEPVITDLPNTAGSRVAFACVRPRVPAFELLTLGRKLAAASGKRRAEKLGLVVAGFTRTERDRFAEAVLSAIYAAAARMPSFKRKAEQAGPKRIEAYGITATHGFRRAKAEAEGNALARYLSLLPSNRLTPTEYVKILRDLCARRRWKFEFLDVKALAKHKAGAFLAVAQGSPVPDAGIARLRFTPRRRSGKQDRPLILVGKGICYDTGGVNLKTQRHMYGMHGDMQGSAVALGALLALTELGFPHAVECWLALAMNHIGPKSYKPDDVVTAADGTSIEVVHTDAEGRMVLADTLALASRQKPRLIIDFATLTGACVYSLGSAYSGVFSNRGDWLATLVEAGRRSGERVWPFPLDEDYDKALESEIADVKQCTVEGEADHILAARFLRRFVADGIDWIHIDLAASRHKGGLAHVPTDTTGFGVRYALSLLLDSKVLSARR
jgi:leucyl aminopeptidase